MGAINDIEHELVIKATSGDKSALEQILIQIKDMVYNLSVKMLFSKEDAEDATQDILVKIINNLPKFRGDSKFTTWVYSIARNHLITAKKKRAENQHISFDIMKRDLSSNNEYKAFISPNIESGILVADLKIGCTQAMLLCLDREKRLIYILSNMFGVNSIEGAKIFDITPQTYRKRLSRINSKMKSFISNNCGLVNPSAKCRCDRRVSHAIENKRINPDHPYFVDSTTDAHVINKIVKTMSKLEDYSDIFKTNPYYKYKIKYISNIITKVEKNIG